MTECLKLRTSVRPGRGNVILRQEQGRRLLHVANSGEPLLNLKETTTCPMNPRTMSEHPHPSFFFFFLKYANQWTSTCLQ